ncbi:MAG: hypothetical protein ABI220_02330 [Candidatus Saccharimonadales bacterium]
MAKNNERKVIDKVLILFGVVAMVTLVAIGSVAWWASSFIGNQVSTELSAQKISFPAKGPALDPEEFPGLQQYAGQQVDNGVKAKAFANEFINVHLSKIADGKTYSEISNEAMADPTNTELQQQKTTLFQGETLRGLLLNAYAFGTVGTIAGAAAIIAFAGAALMFALVLLGLRHMKRAS